MNLTTVFDNSRFPGVKNEGANTHSENHAEIVEISGNISQNGGVAVESECVFKKTGRAEKSSVIVKQSSDTVFQILENPVKKVPIAVIGDLDGNYQAFLKLCLSIGILDSSFQWAGGATKVIFSGDILADAVPNGFDILRHIGVIRKQARKFHGDVTILAGNHEEFLIGYLIGKSINQGSSEIDELMSMYSKNHINKIKGMAELYAFGKTRNEILTNMRSDEKIGRPLLVEITKMKLVEITGDTIHFHTPPNATMLKLVSRFGNPLDAVNRINSIWKRVLEELLLENTDPKALSIEMYKKYASVFLKTANDGLDSLIKRSPYPLEVIKKKYVHSLASDNKEAYQELIQHGITRVVYGHTNAIVSVEDITFVPVNRTSQVFEA